jgi:hypothetical protein
MQGSSFRGMKGEVRRNTRGPVYHIVRISTMMRVRREMKRDVLDQKGEKGEKRGSPLPARRPLVIREWLQGSEDVNDS